MINLAIRSTFLLGRLAVAALLFVTVARAQEELKPREPWCMPMPTNGQWEVEVKYGTGAPPPGGRPQLQKIVAFKNGTKGGQKRYWSNGETTELFVDGAFAAEKDLGHPADVPPTALPKALQASGDLGVFGGFECIEGIATANSYVRIENMDNQKCFLYQVKFDPGGWGHFNATNRPPAYNRMLWVNAETLLPVLCREGSIVQYRFKFTSFDPPSFTIPKEFADELAAQKLNAMR